jgi:hypothetical protein
MHLILKRSLIFVTLMIAGLAVYVMWFDMKAEKYDETVIPYLNKALPKVSSWNYLKFKPMLSPRALAEFETDKGQAVYRLFTQLGNLESIGKPQYISNKSESSSGLGEVEIVSYSVPVVFESGPAVIKILLVSNGQSYFIHHLGISSGIYAEPLE